MRRRRDRESRSAHAKSRCRAGVPASRCASGAADGAFPEGALASKDNDGSGLHMGRNSFLQASWLPPDPPPGHGTHRYAFQMFALEPGPAFDGTPGREAVLEAVRERGLASGCLIGTYERPDTSIPIDDGAAQAVASGPTIAG